MAKNLLTYLPQFPKWGINSVARSMQIPVEQIPLLSVERVIAHIKRKEESMLMGCTCSHCEILRKVLTVLKKDNSEGDEHV